MITGAAEAANRRTAKSQEIYLSKMYEKKSKTNYLNYITLH